MGFFGNLLQGVGKTIGNIFGGGLQYQGVKDTNKSNELQAQLARDWQTNERLASQDWTLEQWNREQDYNSPQAVSARLQAAGFSPMAYLDGLGNTTEMPTAPSDPSTQIPQMQNPFGGFADIFNNAVGNYLAFQKLDLEKDKVKNDTLRANSESIYNNTRAMVEQMLATGKVRFLNTQIDLNLDEIKTNKSRREQIAKQLCVANMQMQQMKQWIEQSKVEMRVKDWNVYASKEKLPWEVKLMGQDYLNGVVMHENVKLDNIAKGHYVYDGEYDKQMQYQSNKMYWDAIESQNTALDHANKMMPNWYHNINASLETTGKFVDMLTNSMQGFMFYQVGKSRQFNMLQMMQQSTRNPIGFSY